MGTQHSGWITVAAHARCIFKKEKKKARLASAGRAPAPCAQRNEKRRQGSPPPASCTLPASAGRPIKERAKLRQQNLLSSSSAAHWTPGAQPQVTGHRMHGGEAGGGGRSWAEHRGGRLGAAREHAASPTSTPRYLDFSLVHDLLLQGSAMPSATQTQHTGQGWARAQQFNNQTPFAASGWERTGTGPTPTPPS
jgi:hypothetical protein